VFWGWMKFFVKEKAALQLNPNMAKIMTKKLKKDSVRYESFANVIGLPEKSWIYNIIKIFQ
jgi:hypothetical protein